MLEGICCCSSKARSQIFENERVLVMKSRQIAELQQTVATKHRHDGAASEIVILQHQQVEALMTRRDCKGTTETTLAGLESMQGGRPC